MVDTHTHLNLEPLFPEYENYLTKALSAGVTRMMIVGVNIETSQRAIQLAQTHPELWAAVGVHPDESEGQWTNESMESVGNELEELIQEGHVSAIGECGLDYSGSGDHEAQKQMFLMHTELAIKHDLPLIIHCRNTRRSDEVVSYSAYDDLISLLSSLPERPRFVLHCVSGPVEYVQQALAMGAFISFAGNVTYPNARAIRDVLQITPFDRLLLETDAPFLSPQSKRGTQNEPANVVDTGKFVANFLGKSFEEIDRITTQNALNLFTR